jgi:hypothetical protein
MVKVLDPILSPAKSNNNNKKQVCGLIRLTWTIPHLNIVNKNLQQCPFAQYNHRFQVEHEKSIILLTTGYAILKDITLSTLMADFMCQLG